MCGLNTSDGACAYLASVLEGEIHKVAEFLTKRRRIQVRGKFLVHKKVIDLVWPLTGKMPSSGLHLP